MKDLGDKRFYKRVNVDANAMIIVANSSNEIECKVKNISEFGIGFEIPREQNGLDNLQLNKLVDFQFVDEYTVKNKLERSIVVSQGVIKHIEEKEDKIILGCYTSSKQFREYASFRLAAEYIKLI